MVGETVEQRTKLRVPVPSTAHFACLWNRPAFSPCSGPASGALPDLCVLPAPQLPLTVPSATPFSILPVGQAVLTMPPPPSFPPSLQRTALVKPQPRQTQVSPGATAPTLQVVAGGNLTAALTGHEIHVHGPRVVPGQTGPGSHQVSSKQVEQ